MRKLEKQPYFVGGDGGVIKPMLRVSPEREEQGARGDAKRLLAPKQDAALGEELRD